ncbi:serine/threonine protein kinase [Ahniella affigens]|nr:serine/threonine-protein kinase [Ahniella affigens]
MNEFKTSPPDDATSGAHTGEDPTMRFATGGAFKGRLLREFLAAPQTAEPGTRIGAFEVREQIGSGGMGAVFRAERISGGFEQTVAIKLILGRNPTTLERFRVEREILAGLRHPNIAQLVDGGETADGSLYLAMEYVDGMPLDEYCNQRGLDTKARLRMLLKIADALAHAHRNLVIHRDIKPTNILVNRADGRPKLLDFGIAKLFGGQQDRDLTQQTLGPMTPTYAAPEQFRAEPITVATDIYQFGVLMFWLLSGGLPYDTPTNDLVAWARAVIEEEPLTLSKARIRSQVSAPAPAADLAVGRRQRRANRDLDAIVQMALMKEPNQRYGSMHALIADLEAFLDGRPVVARHGGALYRLGRFITRHRWAVIATTSAALGLAVATAVAVVQAHQARSEAERLHASVALLNSVFQAADVNAGHGGRRSLEDLLDVAAKDVMQRLDHHPDLRAGVLMQVADAFTSMGLPARAAPLYQQAIDDFRTRGEHGTQYLQALERGALAMYWNGNADAAKQLVAEAEPLAVSASDEHATVRDGLLFTQWQILRSEARAAECFEVAEASVRNAERASPAVRDTLMQKALVRRGTSATDLERFLDGERDLLAAVALGTRLWGEKHAATLKAKQALGWHYASRGDYEKGLAILEPAGQQVIEVFGANSQEWARNLYNRGNIYLTIPGRWRDAVAAYQESSQVYREAASPGIGIGALFTAAGLLRVHGQCDEALPMYVEVERVWRQPEVLRAPVSKRLYVELASCQLATGALDAAKASYQLAVDALANEDQSSVLYAEFLAVGATIASAERDAPRAEALLSQALHIVGDNPDYEPLRQQWQIELARLRRQ